MILSKGQLALAGAGDVVDLHADGSASVVSRGVGLVAVGPVPEDVRSESVLEDSGPVEAALPAKGLAAVMVPQDKLFGGRLEMVDARDEGEVVAVEVRDETRRSDVTRVVKSRRGRAEGVRARLRGALRERGVRVVVNRKWLLNALKVIERACPDPDGRAPLWLSVGEEGTLVMRGVNVKTDQRALAVGQAYDAGREEWLEDSTWERSLRGGGGVRKSGADGA